MDESLEREQYEICNAMEFEARKQFHYDPDCGCPECMDNNERWEERYCL